MAVAQKSPCASRGYRSPPLTQLSKLNLGLTSGSTLHAESLTVLSKSLSLLSQVRWWNLTQAVEQCGLCRRSRQQFPSPLTLQGAPREPLLTGDSEHLPPRIAEMAFDLIVGPRQAGHVVTVEEARPIAPTYFV